MVFSARGVVPIGYAALAFALGVLFRRTLPAMATTLAVFTVVQIAMPLWIRPHLGEVRDLRRQRRRQRGVLRCRRRWDLRANKAPRIAVAIFSVRLTFTGSVAVPLSASVS
ncbi:hypothetical protein [Streptomyces sp. NBC_00271]|uniref:hypothetical protein n=1 Tax=Streptomyces sp. NBC_00271 TaxID=2975697 RepID=UPI002E2E895D|nr:hypothetical protein [Streptomyces sp. NBC_00271]